MSNQLNQSAIQSLAQALFACESQKDLLAFLEDVATGRELNEMAGRWQAAQLINKKVPYRQVAEATGLSTATVTRVAAWLNGGAGGYKKALSNIHHAH